MAQEVGSSVVVPVKSAMTSKINWIQILGVIGMLGSFFGLPFPAETQAAVATSIGVVVQVITFITRTWFTKSVVASST